MPPRLTEAAASVALDKGKIRTRVPPPSEDAVQRVIVEGLTALGYVVIVTSRRYRRCPKCKTANHRGDGVSRGCPDLFVRHKTWPRGLSVGLEVKRPGPVKWSSLEQRLAHEDGVTFVVKSLEDALQIVEHFALEVGWDYAGR